MFPVCLKIFLDSGGSRWELEEAEADADGGGDLDGWLREEA